MQIDFGLKYTRLTEGEKGKRRGKSSDREGEKGSRDSSGLPQSIYCSHLVHRFTIPRCLVTSGSQCGDSQALSPAFFDAVPPLSFLRN